MVQAMGDERVLRCVGLRRIAVEGLTIRRRRCGKGFVYLDDRGRRIADAHDLARIRSLAIPPNYLGVRIAPDPRAHLQAIGTDVAGRHQYRYHPDWELVRERQKVDRLATLSRTVARIRRRVDGDLALPGPSRPKALAAVVAVVDRTHIRIGCEDYLHSGRSRGASTLLKRHVRVEGHMIAFAFRGKGGRDLECRIQSAPALADAIEEMECLAGPRLFQYRDASGRRHAVTASEVNAYLREISGATVTAKDFRTLAATAAAGVRLARMTPAARPTARRRQVSEVMREVAELLSNTPAVVRKSYVHRRILDAFSEGGLEDVYADVRSRRYQSRGEALVSRLFAGSGVEQPGASASEPGRLNLKEREHAGPGHASA